MPFRTDMQFYYFKIEPTPPQIKKNCKYMLSDFIPKKKTTKNTGYFFFLIGISHIKEALRNISKILSLCFNFKKKKNCQTCHLLGND